MRKINISQLPNQSFSVQINSLRFDITLKETNGVMIATISSDAETIISGARIVSGFPLIPYRYLESGNFILTTLDGDLPDYRKFGVSQFLYYFSGIELLQIRAG